MAFTAMGAQRITAVVLDSGALIIGGASFVLAAAATFIAFWGRTVPLAGTGSLGEWTAVAAGVLGAVVFVVACVRSPRGTRTALTSADAWLRRIFDLSALALAHGLICFLIWLCAFSFVERAFADATMIALPAVLIAATASAISGYLTYLSGARMTLLKVSSVLGLIVLLGAFTSAVTAHDPAWWQTNFSALGETGDTSALVFNVSLVITGALVAVLGSFATSAWPAPDASTDRSTRPSIGKVRWAVIAIGVLLACTGLFPVNVVYWVHTIAARCLAIAFALLIVFVGRWVPGIGRRFLGVSYGFVAVLGVTVALCWPLGLIPLTVVEIMGAALVFSWLVMLISRIARMAPGAEAAAYAEPAVDRELVRTLDA